MLRLQLKPYPLGRPNAIAHPMNLYDATSAAPGGAVLFDPAIYYLIPIEGDDDALTPFQGFSCGVCDASFLLRYLHDAPASAFDLCSPDRVHRNKAIINGQSRYRIIALNVEHLSRINVTIATPFWVVLSWAHSDQVVREWIATCKVAPLHATNSPGVGDLTLDELCETSIRSFIVRRTEQLRLTRGYEAAAGLLLERLVAEPPRKQAQFARTYHNALLPNEHALLRAGISFADTTQFNPTLGDQPVVDAIVTSCVALRDLRREAAAIGEPALILTVPGRSRAMERRFFEAATAARTTPNRTLAKRQAEAWRRLTRNTGYFPTAQDAEFAEDPAVHEVLGIRSLEMRAYSDAIMIRAASELSSTIRLPPRFEHVQVTLHQLTQCYTGNSDKRLRKLARLKLKLLEQLKVACPTEFLEYIDSEHTSIRIVADLPLEWIPMRDGRPLMFKHQTSRIPCTPGNLMFQTLLPHPHVRIPASALKKLLVLRGLSRQDGLYSSLEISIREFCKRSPDFEVSFVDVRSSDEFLSALDGFDGAWLVFDGHGHRTKLGSNIVTGTEELDPWLLRGKVRIPPIVIPLSCDMHPLAHNHSSAASGFLAAGARTCFGSLLPVDGHASARFLGRLIRAAIEMLPLLFTNGVSEISWANLFRIVHHSQFAHELLIWLSERPGVPVETLAQIVGRCGAMAMAMAGIPDYYTQCLDEFAAAIGMTRTAFDALVAEQMPVLDCSLYIQLGDPESIILCKDFAEPAA